LGGRELGCDGVLVGEPCIGVEYGDKLGVTDIFVSLSLLSEISIDLGPVLIGTEAVAICGPGADSICTALFFFTIVTSNEAEFPCNSAICPSELFQIASSAIGSLILEIV
jgi:hypothetical protein